MEEKPYKELSLQEINNMLSGRVADSVRSDLHVPEADETTNDLSRAMVVAFKREKGSAWLYKINLYGDDRHKREAICSEWRGQMVYNFGYDLVAAVQDQQLIDLIHERDNAPYTGTGEDKKRLEAIFERANEIGAENLFWS